jgi:nucleoside-diphosphate-sugar epimerase
LPALLRRGYEVHAVARHPLPRPDVQWHAADLMDLPSLPGLLAAIRPTHLLHLAWYAEHGTFWTSPENRRWVECSVALLQAFQRAGGRFVAAAGSCAEYDWRDGRCDEQTTPLMPATEYGICKHMAHQRMDELCRQEGIGCAWGRIFHLYGPHEHPARFVASIIRALLRNQEAPCTAGTQLRDFLHVEDVAEAFVALLDGEHEGTFNIGAGLPITLADLGRRIAGLIGKPELLKLGALPMSPDDPPVLVPRTRRLQETNWSPRYTLDAGLRHAIEWWRSELSRPAGDSAS